MAILFKRISKTPFVIARKEPRWPSRKQSPIWPPNWGLLRPDKPSGRSKDGSVFRDALNIEKNYAPPCFQGLTTVFAFCNFKNPLFRGGAQATVFAVLQAQRIRNYETKIENRQKGKTRNQAGEE